jgi:hypothetical protein
LFFSRLEYSKDARRVPSPLTPALSEEGLTKSLRRLGLTGYNSGRNAQLINKILGVYPYALWRNFTRVSDENTLFFASRKFRKGLLLGWGFVDELEPRDMAE